MASSEPVKIESVNQQNLTTATSVSLNDQQKTLVGVVLDLFAGKVSLAKLRLWADNAVFEDPITNAKGRKEYEAQWYGLAAVFSAIDRKSYEITQGGNPILMNLKTEYTIKGVGLKKEVNSIVEIHIDEKTGLIQHVKDKWDGQLPDSSFKEVGVLTIFNPFWWARLGGGLAWWMFVTIVVKLPVWGAMRRINATTVPKMVGVPKNAEEDSKKGL